jgi:hypothetical protein
MIVRQGRPRRADIVARGSRDQSSPQIIDATFLQTPAAARHVHQKAVGAAGAVRVLADQAPTTQHAQAVSLALDRAGERPGKIFDNFAGSPNI